MSLHPSRNMCFLHVYYADRIKNELIPKLRCIIISAGSIIVQPKSCKMLGYASTYKMVQQRTIWLDRAYCLFLNTYGEGI